MDRITSASRARRQAALMGSCALGLVLAASPEAAQAQDAGRGFQGNVGTGGVGSVNVTTGSQSTTIDVNSAQAVVNWTPTDTSTSGTIDFLPEGYSASFTSSTLSDYTVLNRILPGGTAKIGLNGNITSSASDGSGGQNVGGNVWFYTPNGFVVGPRATIQVGGLVMTTNDIVFGAANTGGDDLTDANGNVLFRGTTPGSSIAIMPGAEISGTHSNSYIALVAPRIEQGGRVSADRSIAYVAANQVDLKINAGNFDIVVGEGTDDPNGIVHTGTTTGSGSYGFGDVKTMHFVAVPKNTALTMLLSGSIGYVPATSSYYDGGSVVLTAGDDASPLGNIDIEGARFRSALDAHATGDITVAPPSSESVEGINEATFESYTTLRGDESVHLSAAGGTAINAYRGLSIYSSNAAAGGTIDINAGPATLIPPDPDNPGAPDQYTSPGQINVYGGLNADASHYAGSSEDETTGLVSQGGTINLFADGGSIYSDYTYLSARAQGGYGTRQGGDGFGGTINVRAGLGGGLNTGYLSADARGDGGASYQYTEEGSFGGFGGVGHGGAITIADSSGSPEEDPTGGLLGVYQFSLDASSVGGNSLERASGMGGDAFGGTIDITIDRQNQELGYLYAYATAIDGDGGAADPVGGDITMTVGGGINVSLETLYLNASAQASINSVAGAFGKGGTIDLAVTDGASLLVNGTTNLSATADVSYYYYDTNIDSSPDLTGGTITLNADNGAFRTSNLSIDVSANNIGAATRAGIAQGGSASVTAANGGSIATFISSGGECSSCSYGGYFEINAEGYGTSGQSANLATGGDITLSAQSGGTIYADAGEISLDASSSYGSNESSGGVGVTGQGGTIAIDAIGGAIQSGISANVSGQGGDADSGGGSGTGGTIAVRVLEGGELTAFLNASAGGSGGYAYVEGRGGDGTGGRLTFESDASAQFTDFGLEFDGDGQGGGAYAGTGGDGYGGSAQIDVIGGTHAWSQADLSGTGRGGVSQGDGSLAGSGYGSVDGLNFHLGGGATLALDYLALDARGRTGSGGNGNEAIGGAAGLLVDGGAKLNANSIGLSATGMLDYEERSADSYDSTPNAEGGTVSVIADTGGTVTTPFLEVTANGVTGAALTSAGSAKGGSATVGASAGGLIDITPPPFQEGEFLFEGLTIEAQGLGAEGPSAANATGGAATLYTAGGTINSVSSITVNADATAGDFANSFVYDGPASGFNATGGSASVEMRAGGTGGAINAPSLTVVARGLPNGSGEFTPVQGTGGIGQGGNATLSVTQGTLQTGDILVDATGFGGVSAENTSGGAAYISGTGTGGRAAFSLSGGSVDTAGLTIQAQGIGAGGQGETETATASLASEGRGGSASFAASGGTLNNSGDLRVEASGIGGAGGFNPNTAPGGDGADGFGGTATFTAPAGGNASLGIAGDIRVVAEGRGGDGGLSYSEQQGSGGNATGGTAAMTLADIAFDFGNVIIGANGTAGAGTTGGNAIGGDASFSLVDSLTGAIAPRTIGLLDIAGAGYAGAGAQSIGGSANFTAEVGGLDAALSIEGDLSLYAAGDTGQPGLGITGSISGAPVTVGGLVVLDTPRDAQFSISPTGALNATDDLDVSVGGTFTSTGAISTAGNAYVSGGGGIDMTDLAVGGSTLLTSQGAISVSRDLSSVGPVTVSGSSVLLRSGGGLTFTDADATAGDLEIQTAGDLLVSTADATGALTLTSTGGSVHNTGEVNGGIGITYNAAADVISDTTVNSLGFLTVDAGGNFSAPGPVSALGNVSLSAALGLNLAAVISGGTTTFAASDGALNIASLTSVGTVDAVGRSVTIVSPGALSFNNAQATAGELTLTTMGSLALTQGGASGAVQLSSTSGSVTGAGPVIAGSNLVVGAGTGIQFGTLGNGGTTSLVTQSGPVTIASLTSAGAVTARGGSVSITSPGALTFADLDAVAGDVTVQTAGNLTVNTVDATGQATLTSTGGAIAANGAITANGISLNSLANLASNGLSTPGLISLTSTSGSVSSTGPISAGGSLSVSGNSGVTLGTATSGSTTTLTAANGAINVANLLSTGAVTASGRSLTIGSSGALRFVNAVATAGDIGITTAGNLLVSQATASGALALASTGGTVASTGTLTSGGNAAVSGQAGVALGTLASGGSTTLASTAGNVQVANLASTGAVDASGRAVTIGSNGALSFSNAGATAGNLAITTAGNLTLAQANASGSLALTSTGGSVTATGLLAAGGNAAVAGNLGISLGTMSSGGTTTLTSANGAVGVSNLASTGAVAASGRSVTIGSTGALTFADLDATAGNIAVQTAGNLTVNTVDATGSVTLVSTGGAFNAGGAINANGITLSSLANLALNGLATPGAISLTSTSGAVTSTGPIAAGGNLSVNGNSGVTLGTAQSGGATSLRSSNGNVAVGALTSTGNVTATGRSVQIASPGALAFAFAAGTAGDLNLTSAGNLSLDQGFAAGALRLVSTGGSVTSSFRIDPVGSAFISGNTGIALGALTSSGTTGLESANGAIAVNDLRSSGTVTASGQSIDIRSTSGLTFADLDAKAGNIRVQTGGQLLVNTVDATGSATLISLGSRLVASGAINANGITLSSADNLALADLATVGAISLTSTSGSVTASGVIDAGTGLTVSGNSGIALDTASSGGTTSLSSASGTVQVVDLTSAGAVMAAGRSVTIGSSGALSFADLDATAGGVAVTTAGDLTVSTVDATGAVSLTSSGGAVAGAGPVNAGNDLAVSGANGVSLGAATSGGTTVLASSNGAVAVSDLASVGAVTASGRSVTIGSTGALSFADLDATAGGIAVQTAGNLAVNTVDATGAVGLTSTGGTVSASGPVSAGSNLALSGNGGITLGTANSGGTTALSSANGAIVVTNLASSGAVTAAGRAVTIGSNGALTFADLDATAGNIAVQTAGNLAVNTVDATGSITLTSTGGSLQTSGAINGNGLALSSLASLQLGSGLATGGALSLTSTSGSVSATGPVSAGGNVAASGQTGVSFGTLSSGGTTNLAAANGAVAVTALTSAGAVTASGRSVDLRGPASLAIASAQATAGNLALQAAQNLTVGNGSATGTAALSAGGNLTISGTVDGVGVSLAGGNVTIGGQARSTAALDVLANQLFTVNGSAIGQAIGLTAGDIAIGQTGRIGSRGVTKSITLRNRAVTSPMNIGGTGQQGQFSLDKSEAARLFADQSITFVSQASTGAGGDARIGDLALSFGGDSANLGAGGLLKVDAGGVVTVNGSVALTTVSDTDTFSIDPQRINVIAGSGSIVMKNAAGALQGALELQAGTIAVADQTTLDTIAALSDFAAISAALDKPGAAGPDGGYLQAGSIEFQIGQGLFIQNGGASTKYDDRRGFRAGELNIESTGTNPMIAINGVITAQAGDLVGLDTIQGVTVNGAAATTLDKGALFTLNGCAAGVNCGIPEYSFGGLSSDELEQLLATADDPGKGPVGQPIQMESTQPLITPPLVDEPITGVGNDDLWQVKCTPEGDKGCPAEEGTQ